MHPRCSVEHSFAARKMLGGMVSGVQGTRPSCFPDPESGFWKPPSDFYSWVRKLRVLHMRCPHHHSCREDRQVHFDFLWRLLLVALRIFTTCIFSNRLWFLALHMGFNSRRLLCATQVTKVPCANAEELPYVVRIAGPSPFTAMIETVQVMFILLPMHSM